ncbi:MAG: ABC transporter ATP-binding protein [Acidimicrobiales bacterium]
MAADAGTGATGAGPLLAVRDLHAGYGDLTILRGVDLELAAGSMTAVIGANGAGKSTLLKAVFGTVRASRGRIEVNGVDVTGASAAERIGDGVVLVPQGRNNFPQLDVVENLEMGAFTRTDKQVKQDIAAALERFPILGERRNEMAGNLSGGEQQLLEMAMAFMLCPRLVLVDEPSLGLSPKMQEVVFGALADLRAAGVGILMVEQNAVQALNLADSAIVLELGRIGASGSGVEMLDDAHVRKAYLGLAPVDTTEEATNP